MTQTDGNVNIHFTDYGKGIPDSDMPFIFDKFYRGKNVDKEQGSGLGLYIVKTIIKKHGGTITVHSKETEYTAFTVTLPLVK